MQILMSTDTVGGVWTYALELSRALRPHGVRISLATMGAKLTPDQRRDTEMLDNVELFESEYRLEWMQDPWEDVDAAGDWLLEIASRVKPDLVHMNHFAHGHLPWNVPCLMVGHSCVLSWHQAVRHQPAGEEWNRYRAVVSRGLQSADLVVAPTNAMLNQLERDYGPFRSRRAILNGRRSDFGIPAIKENFVLTAGRVWDEAKNISAVTAIASRLDWPVCVAGLPHPDATSTEDASTDSLQYLGRLTSQEIESLYSRASIYALPARYEPFGLTPLEAALAGCALVLGDIPTLREVWGDAAFFVPPEDHQALRDAINQFIAHPEQRAEAVRKSHARALELNESNMAAGYLEAYRELLEDASESFSPATPQAELITERKTP